MSELIEDLSAIVGPKFAWSGSEAPKDDTHDEALTGSPIDPIAVVRPCSTAQVSRLLALANDRRIPLIARGSGTGVSGGCRPVEGGIVVAFDRMNRILEIDLENNVAVIEPGVTLAQLDEALKPTGLIYPVYPGEMTASLGGNVATNAGGMRAIRYGVTRHHVLGLQAVLAGGEVIRTGGRFVKCSSGYDLTQLIIGSEGTLAFVTEVTVKLTTRLAHSITVLAPFESLDSTAAAVHAVLSSGVEPTILEYIDAGAMLGITSAADINLGLPAEVVSKSFAYLVVVLENAHADRLDEDVEVLARQLTHASALDVYILPPTAGTELIAAREKAFYVAKAAGANDIIDSVIPRAAIPGFMRDVVALATTNNSLVSACGHVGDGNVHFSLFQSDPELRRDLIRGIFELALDVGGAISGEHGIGTEKHKYFLEFEDPTKLDLMRRIKSAFDPRGILGPGRLAG